MSRLYSKRRWQRVSARKLSRNPLCEGCEAQPSRHADHIVPLDQDGAPFDMSNLQALCVPCHTAKTACDKAGTRWIRPVHRGCDVDGFPFDPLAGGRSIAAA
jgi:5-methylcytosine-specific restriction protein A